LKASQLATDGVGRTGGFARSFAIVHVDNRDARWLAYLKAANPSLFQHPDWASLMEEVYGFPARVALAVRDDEVIGGLPYSDVEDFRGGRRIASAFADVCEPLGDGVWHDLERALSDDGIPWQIRSRVEPTSLAAERRQIGLNLVAVFPAGVEQAMRFCETTQPKQVRHAIRAGVSMRRIDDESAVDIFYELHSRLRTTKFGLLPQPRSFFEALVRRYFPDRGLLLTAELDGRVLGAEVLLTCGDTLYIKFSAADQSALKLRPMDFLFYKALELAAQEGLRAVDFGISEVESLVFFKRKYSTVEQPVFAGRYLQRDQPPHVLQMDEALRAVTAALAGPDVPLAAAQQGGAALYRYFV
jgi:CelD/BcsL family acetyltransferase involved in cellulose biosynthesis